ncbi:DUF2474 domain-containing protein [Rhizobium calliandrae]|uniref:DUF2474 domain-containing protein n=1 Tax=Rhizobium calliandrae TaxID=1312182 RepID=A0ABT7KNP7_9HYPH|nr:DUF2474 domain-containing protein [Rhizobium calliandrae]MDL2409563.1 DUF2474 domain-containing protein [Rhizobium calliandrae]
MASRTRLAGYFKRLGWMVAIWVLSVVTLGIFASVFRMFMSLAGLTA